MTEWTAKDIVAQLDAFKAFLTARGAEVFEVINQWELLRFKSGTETSVVYTKKTGVISFYGDAETAWRAFKSNTSWRALPATKRRNSKTHSITAIRARDGDTCFYCLEYVTEETQSEEHLVSVTHGGPNHIANKVLAHVKCNQLAGNLSASEKIKLHIAAHTKRKK